jgi:hypothetical protein
VPGYRASFTTSKDSQEKSARIQKLAEELFGHVDETAQIVLKGHLLIEESLESIISTFVFHPEFVEMAKLSFAQKLSIARAMSLNEHENEMWEIAAKLNSLRNEIAHKLYSPKRVAKTKALIELYLRLSADMPESDTLNEHEERVLLSFAVVLFLGFLKGFQAEIDRRRLIDEALQKVDAFEVSRNHPKNSG